MDVRRKIGVSFNFFSINNRSDRFIRVLCVCKISESSAFLCAKNSHIHCLGTFESSPPPTEKPYEASDGNKTTKKSFKHYNKDKDPDFCYVKNWRGEIIRVPKRTNKYQERKYLGKFFPFELLNVECM